MTIEERATEFSLDVPCSNPHDLIYHGYIQGATDQHKIDDEEQTDALFIQRQMLIEKVCEYIKTHSTYAIQPELYIEELRKIMEE